MGKALLPDSLFGRLFAAIVGVIALLLVVVVLLILRERRDFALLQDAASTAGDIAQISQYLAQLPPDQRDSSIAQLRDERMSVEEMRGPRRPPDERGPEVDPMAQERELAAKVRQQLGDAYRVSTSPPRAPPDQVISLQRGHGPGPPPPGPRGSDFAPEGHPPDGPPGPGGPGGPGRLFDVTVAFADGGHVVFRTAAPRGVPPLRRQIFVELAILTAALSVVLYVMTRTITRPLARLERAADAIGRGAQSVGLKEEGARELRGATRAFNAMQDRLRRYLDSRTRVLAAISHDLRTPLTRLRLRVESIEDESLRARCTADLDEMASMVSAALGMFRGLNDEEAAAPVDMNELVSGLAGEFIELGGEVAVEGSAAPYVGKRLALKRCLGNLVLNAIQYGQRATIRVEDGETLIVRVIDAGEGIPPEMLDQVFEPFFRLESSRSRDTGGTGLGLSIARDIALAHGGALTLRNRAEGGLEAVLELPRG